MARRISKISYVTPEQAEKLRLLAAGSGTSESYWTAKMIENEWSRRYLGLSVDEVWNLECLAGERVKIRLAGGRKIRREYVR
ncbi:hypothetical protein CU669_08360 [Paramagnetospirillum kuznetsovii]|uniref:Uncharacterized protein n=1 Tax=Paramagnetospirillum kuznetsovii TaxID=2053833 RepID=A0A364P042_9PROT|nr:hypothetical protein [Paramagnetospirillum kuznetsovii]RAU22676.1 hypothetical protein CU669_08360 [Paramagnetospirillum kuznetsovii]